MTDLHSYTYTVLRYIHDTISGEFVNVGVAIYSPSAPFTAAKCRKTYSRLKCVFPALNGDNFRNVMRHIESRFSAANQRLGSELSLERFSSVLDVARSVLPADDSSLQWSPVGSGRAKDVEAELDHLFTRMVARYEDEQSVERKSDDDVWRDFSRALEARRVLRRLKPKTITVHDDEVKFQHAWKNGSWNCLEPVSFDLSAPEGIREKAHRWLGQIQSVSEAPEQFHVYFLLGRPTNHALLPAFNNAVSILKKAPRSDVYIEEDAAELAERIEKDLASQDARS